ELVDQPLASEEELGVGCLERSEPLERTDGRRGDRCSCCACLAGKAQRRVLDEDRPLELLQLEGWFEPELLVEESTCTPIELQALRLAAAAVERDHQLRAEALPVGGGGDQHLER